MAAGLENRIIAMRYAFRLVTGRGRELASDANDFKSPVRDGVEITRRIPLMFEKGTHYPTQRRQLSLGNVSQPGNDP